MGGGVCVCVSTWPGAQVSLEKHRWSRRFPRSDPQAGVPPHPGVEGCLGWGWFGCWGRAGTRKCRGAVVAARGGLSSPSQRSRAFWYLRWKTPYKSHVLLFIITVVFSPSQPWLHCSIFLLLRNFLSCLCEWLSWTTVSSSKPQILSSGTRKCTAACAKPGLHA